MFFVLDTSIPNFRSSVFGHVFLFFSFPFLHTCSVEYVLFMFFSITFSSFISLHVPLQFSNRHSISSSIFWHLENQKKARSLNRDNDCYVQYRICRRKYPFMKLWIRRRGKYERYAIKYKYYLQDYEITDRDTHWQDSINKIWILDLMIQIQQNTVATLCLWIYTRIHCW